MGDYHDRPRTKKCLYCHTIYLITPHTTEYHNSDKHKKKFHDGKVVLRKIGFKWWAI